MIKSRIGEFGYIQLILLASTAIVFLGYYIDNKSPIYKLETYGVEAKGLITSIEPSYDTDIIHNGNAYEFKSADGKLYHGTTDSKGMLIIYPEDFEPLKPARQATVVYLKDNPSVNSLRDNVVTADEHKRTNIYTICFGGFLLLLAGCVAWFDYRDRHPKPVWNPMEELEIIPVIATTEEEKVLASTGNSGQTWKGYCKTHKQDLHSTYLSLDGATSVVADHEDDFPKHFVCLKKLVMKDGGPFEEKKPPMYWET